MENRQKTKLTEKYEVGLMIVSVFIVALMVVGLTVWPDKGKEIAGNLLNMLTHTFGSTMQFITVIILVFLIILGVSKYGNIRLGNKKPKYRTLSWVSMMFFTGLGAGTVYWAFLEWGNHFNAGIQLEGAAVSEAYNYELSLAYSMYDWGPAAWALLCVFVLPFAYHYYVKKDSELKFSALCKYAVGEKRVKSWVGKIIDFIFIFAAVGSICITAGTSGSTISAAIADLLGIQNSFTLTIIVLLGVAVLYSLSNIVGIEKGMRKISDWNVYFCAALLLFMLVAGPTRFILDSLVNSMGVLGSEFFRMTTYTDPIAQSGYPQDWTVFYLVYWFVFGPFTGLFVAKISEGRKIRDIILNMLVSGTAGLFLFFGIIGAYGQNLKINGILDIPAMITNGESEEIASAVMNTLPFSKIAIVLYLVVIILFLATTLDSCSFTLSSTISKNLKGNEDPNKGLKFVWCLVTIAIPLAISYAGTDIDTIKSIVLATGLPLVVVLAIIYWGFMREMFKDYGKMTKDEIIKAGEIQEGINEGESKI